MALLDQLHYSNVMQEDGSASWLRAGNLVKPAHLRGAGACSSCRMPILANLGEHIAKVSSSCLWQHLNSRREEIQVKG